MQDMKQKSKKNGFTFIELLIVTSIMGLVSLTIYSSLNSGLKIWYRLNKSISEEDVGIFFDKFRTDVANTTNFSLAQFFGGKNSIKIPALVVSKNFENLTPGLVEYSFVSGSVMRTVKDCSNIYSGRSGVSEPLLKMVKSFSVNYYKHDEEKNMYVWAKEWGGAELPLAVRIILEVGSGVENKRFTKTVYIPIA